MPYPYLQPIIYKSSAWAIDEQNLHPAIEDDVFFKQTAAFNVKQANTALLCFAVSQMHIAALDIIIIFLP